MKTLILTIFAAILLSGCATTIEKSEQDRLYQIANEELKTQNGEMTFLSYPSVGRKRDAIFMAQRKSIGRPTQTGQNLATLIEQDKNKPVRLAITGASSARTSYIVHEAFSLIDPKITLPNLTLLFIGEKMYETDLKKVIEAKGSTFLFYEYQPPVYTK